LATDQRPNAHSRGCHYHSSGVCAVTWVLHQFSGRPRHRARFMSPGA
jgi:hypothetical protein